MKGTALAITLGKAARDLRDALGLTQRAAAEALGISFVHLCNIEKERALPSEALVDKIRTLWGVDLHVLAWCWYGDMSKLPASLRRPAEALAAGWKQHLNAAIERHRKANEV